MEELNIDIKSFFKDLACEYIHVCKSDYLFKQGEGGVAIYFINEGAVPGHAMQFLSCCRMRSICSMTLRPYFHVAGKRMHTQQLPMRTSDTL